MTNPFGALTVFVQSQPGGWRRRRFMRHAPAYRVAAVAAVPIATIGFADATASKLLSHISYE